MPPVFPAFLYLNAFLTSFRICSSKKVNVFFKNIVFYATFNQFYTSKQRNQLHDKHGACAICALVTPRCHQNREGGVCVYTITQRKKI